MGLSEKMNAIFSLKEMGSYFFYVVVNFWLYILMLIVSYFWLLYDGSGMLFSSSVLMASVLASFFSTYVFVFAFGRYFFVREIFVLTGASFVSHLLIIGIFYAALFFGEYGLFDAFVVLLGSVFLSSFCLFVVCRILYRAKFFDYRWADRD